MGDHNRMTAGFWSQTWLLSHKNWLTKRRQNVKKLIGEIVMPIIYLGFLALLVSLNNIRTYPREEESHEVPQDVLYSNNRSSIPLKKAFNSSYVPYSVPPRLTISTIHVVPDDPFSRNFTQYLMESVWVEGSNSSSISPLTFEYYATEEDLLRRYENQSYYVNMALILPNQSQITSRIAGGPFNYTIRMNPDLQLPYPTDKKRELNTCRGRTKLEPGLEETKTCPVNGYFFSEFLALQSLVEQALVKLNDQERNTGASTKKLTVTMENYPKEKYSDGMPVVMRIFVPLCSVIPMLQIVNNLLVLIVTEKEQKVKDGLRMVGVHEGAYWLSWVGLYGILVIILSVLFTTIMFTMGVLRHLPPLILFLLFFLFGISIITFSFALTPIFHKPKAAGIAGMLVVQFASFVFLAQTFVEDSGGNILLPFKLISSLAFTSGLDHACRYEYSGGISWADLIPGGKGDGILYSLIFLVFDIFFYGVIAVYLDNVIPNEFGVKKHPLYCFMPSFWKESKTTSTELALPVDGKKGSEGQGNESIDLHEDDNIEPVESALQGKEVIRIRNISKTYYESWPGFTKKTVEAVKDISLNIYKGQITAILGRNGAGKSTLFNILTGLVSPTTGKAIVFGLDTSRPYDQAKLRKMTGVCLQSDLHFNSLTVEEHLQFYGKLRGLSKKDLEDEINKILHDLKLTDRRSLNVETLSGGQKRKLSVAIALIGDPKVILLDEPTAGLDPVSRRHLWTLLQQKKKGKVILLTTHFMDEADGLADRKAIVHDGVLRCAGSSLFLKNRYGVGYCLTVEMSDRNSDPKVTDKIIAKWIPEAVASRKVVGHEIKYSLPNNQASKFPSIFAELETEIEKQESLKGYGVSMTTLEEVFLKISNDLDPLINNSANNAEENEHQEGERNLIQDFGDVKRCQRRIFWSMCSLRYRRLIRPPQSIFDQLVLTLILVAIGLGLIRITDKREEFVLISDPAGIYPSSDLRVAVHELGRDFSNFLNRSNILVTKYSGKEDLLNVNPGQGSMAAVTIKSQNFSGPHHELTAAIRINGTFLHAPPIMLDLISKYFSKMSQSASGSSGEESLLFGGSNLEYRPFRNQTNMVFDQASLYALMFLIGPAFIFLSIGMVMEIVKDRETKARNHLRVNGLSFTMYFSSIFFVFGSLSLIVTVYQLCLILIFQVQAFMNPYAMVILSTLLLLHILPALLFSSIFSYVFDKMDSAQSAFPQVALWSGPVVAIIISVVDNTVTNRSMVEALHIAVSFLDIFYIPFGAYYWTMKQYLTYIILNGSDEGISFSTYNTPQIISMYICMLVQIPLFVLLLLVADVLQNGGRPSQAILSLLKLQKPAVVHSLESGDNRVEVHDDDVAKEKLKIQRYFSGIEPNDRVAVATKNVVKSYKEKKVTKHVLNGVNLIIEEGEVLGLLGHNGAGKTTTMKMITAEEAPDSGKIHLCSYDITSNMSKAFRQLGFCPQHDAIWENITLREHLELYATIRGIPQEKREKLVAHFLQGLKISDHADKHAAKLSGGTKRKLSYAMSMLGAPKIVLLDEPSTGMDPQSKRFLWNTVLGTFKDSRGAMLTTHSMEEADVLCTRIAIMVKGSILCIGSPQHLKNKFGTGYTMEIKLKPESVTNTTGTQPSEDVWVAPKSSVEESPRRLKSQVPTPMDTADAPIGIPQEFLFVRQHFPKSNLVEAFGNRAVFSIPNDEIHSISETFSTLEKLKSSHNVEEYSFSQTTLEQVFLTFAKYNDENEDH